MKTTSPLAFSLALFLSLMIAIPGGISAAPQTTGQRAGEVSRLIPAVSISRGAKIINASAKTVVDWQDLLNTKADARARVALDDGSVLNVGSDSSIKVVKHDAGAQQTELELAYGKLRTQAQKITKPDGKFEVHT
ncbi:MAG: FecR family protein, partial [Candidatus Acidiferrum sp.]